jgi:hypothetical protein
MSKMMGRLDLYMPFWELADIFSTAHHNISGQKPEKFNRKAKAEKSWKIFSYMLFLINEF